METYRKIHKIYPILYLTILLIIVSFGIVWNSKQIYADYIFKKASNELERSDTDLDNAIVLLEKTCDICPRESFYADELLKAYGQKAGILLNMKKTADAEKLYEKSLIFLGTYVGRTCNPTVTYMTAALNSYRIGFIDDSISSLSAALIWDRWNTHIHNVLSGFYFFRYAVANDDNDLLKAFEHSYTTTRILKYIPEIDVATFKNSIMYANMIYGKNKDKNIFIPLQDVFSKYAYFAKKSQETEKEFSEAIINSEGTECQQNIKASYIFYKYKVGDLSPDKAVSELKAIKVSNDKYLKNYLNDIKE